jgi:hypothetical protein
LPAATCYNKACKWTTICKWWVGLSLAMSFG